MVDRVRAWHPEVPFLRETYHADLDHVYPVHAHDDGAVMLVDRGAVSYGLDGAAHQAVPAAVTLLPPGIPHDGRPARAGEGYRKRVLYLLGDWLSEVTAARIARRPTLADVALELRAHPSHLVRVFSRTYGIAPHRYVVTRRVDAARRLLVDGVRPAEVAARVGFHDQAHLTRHFRRVLGVTPAVFAGSGRGMP